jgi:flagellar basal body rod protein FlgG
VGVRTVETFTAIGGYMNIGTSLSALNALSTQMNVTGKNLANVNTGGYKSSRVVIESGQGQTVKANVVKNNSQSPITPNKSAENGVEEMSNVDVVKDMAQLIPAQHAYNANLKVIESSLEMRGTLINMIA